MNHHAMRRQERAVVDINELRSIVECAKVLRIASSDDDGLFITPVSFGYDWEDGVSTPTFWIHCAHTGRKTAAWTNNPDVALELDVPGEIGEAERACDYSTSYQSIMATGRMARVTYNVQKRWGLQRLMEHMAPGAPTEFDPKMVEATDVWRIDLSDISGKKHEGAEHMSKMSSSADEQTTASSEPERKPLSQSEVETLLVGEKCPGCGLHCPLAEPTCGHGAEHLDRRLKRDGYYLQQ